MIKRVVLALTLGLMVVGIVAVPVLAAAQKVDLVSYSSAANTPPDPGTGFVVLNNSTGGAELTVSLKGAVAGADYDVYAMVNGGPWFLIGTTTTNVQGNANFHLNEKGIPPGTYSVVIALNRLGATRFITPVVTLTVK